MRRELLSLTGLRGIAALWVLGYHTMLVLQHLGSPLAIPVGVFGRAGYLGVDVFFVLSGFVIAYNYGDDRRWTPDSYGSFLWKRLARIYPVHVAGLALFGAFLLCMPIGTKAGSHTLPELIASIALVHAWTVPVRGTWNTVSWSVSLEWAAYLTFPAIALVTGKLRSTAVIAGVVAGLFLALFLVATSISFQGTMAYGVFRIAAEFTSGVLLFRLWTLRHDAVSPYIAIAALMSLTLGGNALDSVIGKKTAFIYIPFLSAVVVYSFVCAPRVLSGSVLQHLGRISYSLYIVHGVVLRFARGTIRAYGLAPEWILVGSLSAIGLAHIVYSYLEQPARAWLLSRHLIKGSSTLNSVQPLPK
jgi:peptidoglycan/LPS O-acetylase OafA/YrhL